MAKQSIRSIRKGSVQWNEEDRLQMVSIDDILGICEKHPQHNYLFLTKNPKRYTQYGVPYGKENMWYG